MSRTQTDPRTCLEEYQLAIANLSPKTQRWYTEKLTHFVGWADEQKMTLAQMRPTHLRRYLEDVKKHPPKGRSLSTYTLHGYAQVVKGFFAWLEDEGLVETSPARRLEMPRVEVKVIEVFSSMQVKALLAAARQTRFPYRDVAVLAVLFDTGLRASELCTLSLDDTAITPTKGVLKVTGKGRKEREVGLGPQARLALSRYLHRERPVCLCPETFLAKGKHPFEVRGLESLFTRLGTTAHISGVRCSPHTCRHTFAVNFLRQGGDVYKLSRLMGHSSVTVTEQYLRAMRSEDARDNAFSVLDALWQAD